LFAQSSIFHQYPITLSQEEHTWRAQPSALLQQQLFHSQGLTILPFQLLIELQYHCFRSKVLQPCSSQLSILPQKLLSISRDLQMHQRVESPVGLLHL
jgi:hypothetical protein